jgi:hypothetical protein
MAISILEQISEILILENYLTILENTKRTYQENSDCQSDKLCTKNEESLRFCAPVK